MLWIPARERESGQLESRSYNSEAGPSSRPAGGSNQDPEPGCGVVADLRFPFAGRGALSCLAPNTSLASNAEHRCRGAAGALRIEESCSLIPRAAIRGRGAQPI